MNRDLAEIIRAMNQTHGWDISRYDESFLLKSLEKRRGMAAAESLDAYVGLLLEDRSEAEALYRSLNITYSEFFRNPLSFALLETVILPRLVEVGEAAGRAEIRVWSAGCAAGQEPYSIAILLDEILSARGSRLSFRIFATDNSEPDLEKARQGTYDFPMLQNVRLKHLRDYFTQTADAYTINPKLRDRIDFSPYDLLDERSVCPQASIFGDFDLAVCGNLLFYYRPDVRRFILDKMRRCLASNGYFMTGEAERAMVEQAGGFRMVAAPEAVFQIVHGNG